MQQNTLNCTGKGWENNDRFTKEYIKCGGVTWQRNGVNVIVAEAADIEDIILRIINLNKNVFLWVPPKLFLSLWNFLSILIWFYMHNLTLQNTFLRMYEIFHPRNYLVPLLNTLCVFDKRITLIGVVWVLPMPLK